MDTDDDYQLALLLQAEYDQETAASAAEDDIYFVGADGSPSLAIPSISHLPLPGSPGSPKSIVDKEWELLDPNPDIRALFLQFNEMYFWSRLTGIEVKWSPRMTLCAGLCVYEGRGGLCSVRLSLPLLKLRPRKDLVETLLHEMIHAYLFVTDNNKDHDGHGPEFQKHMNRLNSSCGSSISIYHTFHDEVDSYRQHWWRCNGPCQKRPPYFGFVKRAMNRAPSSRDTWWSQHQASCGGSYTKVREPEGYGKKTSKSKQKEIEEKKKEISKFKDIRAFMGPGKLLGGGKKDSNKEKSKASSTVSKSNSDDDDVTVVKVEKKNSVSGSSKGHSSGSSKHKSDDHKSHKDSSSHDKHRHSSHSSSKDHDHSKHKEHKSSSKGESDHHKSSDKKHSSSDKKHSSSAKDSDSKKHSSSSKGSSSASAASGSSKKKESSSSSVDKPKKSNVHGVDSSPSGSELGEPSAVAHGSNVHGFVKGTDKSSKGKSSSSAVAFSGMGNVLGSSSDAKHKGDREKHKHEKEKHRHKEEKVKSKEKDKSVSKKRPSTESSNSSNSEPSSKKAKHGEETVFGHGRTSKFRGDKPKTGIALNDPDDMVPCPVCATRVRATDINGHLDSCLGGL
ncbi:DNA-dependent metalloprotease SPRTN-like [Lineus longissimus]|uniref:DNA-dependent metalloprotease SPRTN-like n=1 Tax=Lineus longissimus TaxID=88925 RepID=UPI002B4E8538